MYFFYYFFQWIQLKENRKQSGAIKESLVDAGTSSNGGIIPHDCTGVVSPLHCKQLEGKLRYKVGQFEVPVGL